MKTTGVSPAAFAASISRFSRSEIDAMTTPSGRVKATGPYRTCGTPALTSGNTQTREADQLLGVHRIGDDPAAGS
jgi:hypothetical protein